MAQKVELNRFKNYMLMVHRSVGSDLFRNLYASVDGEETDILRDGILSCAYFVSSVLFHCKLIDDLHTTVRGLESNLQRSGWNKIEEPKAGSVSSGNRQNFLTVAFADMQGFTSVTRKLLAIGRISAYPRFTA